MAAGFSKNLGVCSAFKPELWGVYECRLIVWEMNLKNIVLESDSETLVDILVQRNSKANLEDSILWAIFSLLNKDWQISTLHTYKEGNKCAD